MATLKSIRKRIGSVKNTQKITKAMKMVSAAKLRRAQMAVNASRPYSEGLESMIQALTSQGAVEHPLFEKRVQPKKICMLLFTSNRGLCGGFNSNLLRRAENFVAEHSQQYEVIDLEVIGKKGAEFYRSRHKDILKSHVDWADHFTFEEAKFLANQMIEGYTSGAYDEYYIVYNWFKSALTQVVKIVKLLPFEVAEQEVQEDVSKELPSLIDYLYEPSKQEVLGTLIPKYVATKLLTAHLESAASELGARMTAMDSATKNSSDMIDSLTLQYNRLRQAAITKELLDIVNGAEAIK